METDHIESFGPRGDPDASDSRNFVLCPGKSYDRSPCAPGTGAKLACLHADEKLRRGQNWRQSSILDTVFVGRITELPEGRVIPRISGRAWVNGKFTYNRNHVTVVENSEENHIISSTGFVP
jgi:4-hydroxyproline epimerase